MHPIVRAVDVGYGNVKYTTASSRDEMGMGAKLFPSMVAPPAGTTAGSELLSGRRATVTVKVDGSEFEVGPDVESVIGTRDNRTLHREFTKTAEYKALLMGAISYMGVENIDLLVLGLPVNAGKDKYATLRQRFTGDLEVAMGRKVRVRDVEVVAQPMGSFIDFAFSNGLLGRVKDQNTLIIDVGFFTLDWVVMRGSEPAAARSGGYDAGVSEMLRRVNEAMKKDLGEELDINRLDKGMRTGTIRVYGKEHSMDRWMPAAGSAISEGLNSLLAKVGKSDDIDAIYLSGGGAKLYVEAVQRAFPRHEVRTVGDDAIYSNVRGFQVFGELKASRMARAAA